MTEKKKSIEIDIDTLREIWDFMAQASLQIKDHSDRFKDTDHKFDLIKDALDKKCLNCPFAGEKEDFKKLKNDNIKVMFLGGIIIFLISAFGAPILVRLITQ